MKYYWARFLFMIRGHIPKATGRRGNILFEIRCMRCDQNFICNKNHPGICLPPDTAVDGIFRWHETKINPNNFPHEPE